MKFSLINKNNYNAVAGIYKAGLETRNATFETDVPYFEDWDNKHLPFGRIVIVENQTISGWASLAKVSNRCVYGGMAEVSVYVSASAQGKGVGTKLL